MTAAVADRNEENMYRNEYGNEEIPLLRASCNFFCHVSPFERAIISNVYSVIPFKFPSTCVQRHWLVI